jgi:hypothetical protein
MTTKKTGMNFTQTCHECRTCLLCNRPAIFVGEFRPLKHWRLPRGIPEGTRYFYGACRKHAGKMGAIEEEISKRISSRNN